MPIDVSIIPELKEALGAGYENIIYQVNGMNPPTGGAKKASPKRKRKVGRPKKGSRSRKSLPKRKITKKSKKSRK